MSTSPVNGKVKKGNDYLAVVKTVYTPLTTFLVSKSFASLFTVASRGLTSIRLYGEDKFNDSRKAWTAFFTYSSSMVVDEI